MLEEDTDSDSFVAHDVEPAAVVSLFNLNSDLEGLEVHSTSFLETDQNCLVGAQLNEGSKTVFSMYLDGLHVNIAPDLRDEYAYT